MVSVTVKTPGKPAIQVEFPGKNAQQVTVSDLKKGIVAKFPRVSKLSVSQVEVHSDRYLA
jgi:hypothetical protein